MTHKLILMSHDFKEVHKVIVARRKADVADHSDPLVRDNTRANTSPSAPELEHSEKE